MKPENQMLAVSASSVGAKAMAAFLSNVEVFASGFWALGLWGLGFRGFRVRV